MPAPGARHDAHAYCTSGLYDLLIDTDRILGEKGHQAHADLNPTEKPQGGELTEEHKAANAVLESARAAVE